MIFAEADFFPGLVVDKFADVLVVQSNALGIDRWKLVIVDCITALSRKMGYTSAAFMSEVMRKCAHREGMGSVSKDLSENRLIPMWKL